MTDRASGASRVPGFRPEALDEHTMSHLLSSISDMEHDEHRTWPLDELRSMMLELGYPLANAEQVVERIRRIRTCGACGEPATHLYGAISETREITSMQGLDRLTPSCDSCAGDREATWAAGAAIITAPLWFRLEPKQPRTYETQDLVDILVDSDPGLFADVAEGLAERDAGQAREAMALALRKVAHRIADGINTTDGDVLVDLVTEARVGD